MPLPFSTDTIDSIPEAQRGLYKEVNGKFTLDVEGYEDPVGLKSALAKERDAAKSATRQAQAWQALGKTPEEITQLLEAQAQAERDKLTSEGKTPGLLSNREEMADFADPAAIAAMLEHWREGLEAIGYLDPANPKKLMPRLQALFARTRLHKEEIDLLRGIAKQMLQKK